MSDALPAYARIWDLPVRLTHWGFVLLLPALWWTGEEGELELHRQIGIVMLMLVLFRILWGIFGSSTARFANFVVGPKRILAYARSIFIKDGDEPVGHNPIGAWSVVALLLSLALQVGLGLIAQDVDGIESGPLSHLVSYETSDAAREWHELVFNVILGLVALHLFAILFYVFGKKQNLVTPMITGRKRLPDQVERPVMAPAARAIVCAAASAAFGWWISLGAPLSSAAG